MGRRRDERERVLGPTFVESKAGRSKWRIVVLSPKETDPRRRRVTRWFVTEADAKEVVEQVNRGIDYRNATELGAALDEYKQHLHDKGTGSTSYLETIRRLKLFFPDHEIQVSRVTPEMAEDYYDAFRRRKKDDGEPISVAYHRSTLINARSFYKWCIRRQMVPLNPFATVEGVGKRKRGKAQPTGDEARRLYAHCLPLARAGDLNALAVLMSLLMGLRSADIYKRVVRDVDFGGRVLRISHGKTAMSDRPRHVPNALRAMLGKLAKGRPPFEPLFRTPYTKSGHHTRRWLEQALDKLCTAAGVPRVVPHALKGTAGTLLATTGELADRIADHLSHEDVSTTKKHYVAAGAIEAARTKKGADAIAKGRFRLPKRVPDKRKTRAK